MELFVCIWNIFCTMHIQYMDTFKCKMCNSPIAAFTYYFYRTSFVVMTLIFRKKLDRNKNIA